MDAKRMEKINREKAKAFDRLYEVINTIRNYYERGDDCEGCLGDIFEEMDIVVIELDEVLSVR